MAEWGQRPHEDRGPLEAIPSHRKVPSARIPLAGILWPSQQFWRKIGAMETNQQIIRARSIASRLRQRAESPTGRIVALTGARQTGKTTLARLCFPDYAYVSVEDPAVRPALARLSAQEWIHLHPRAVVDEVQKLPPLVETLKAAYDLSPEVRYVLLGSSQIRLLRSLSESLAGRVALFELWPFTLPELLTSGFDSPVPESRLITWLRSGAREWDILVGIPAASRTYARAMAAWKTYLQFGGMPWMHDPRLTDEDRWDWLRDYHRTYLERDVADLARITDLEPFVRLRRAVALRTACTLNASELARVSGVPTDTARRFLRYLELSYQVFLLSPYYDNPRKRLRRAPKVHFVDPGVLRSVLGRRGELTGEEFESAVVAEIFKQVHNANLPSELFYLRTYDGREVDLLVELEEGFVAIEVKMTEHAASTDARHLRGLETIVRRPVLAGLVVSMDSEVRKLSRDVYAVPAPWLLAPPTV